ncbi:MAG: zinc-dependent alcohol dehydrogenase family protein [Chloroflexi bacterium]|nr:zinc-dependent alcohol dehydrogenase family protein [Chloroflexota bacterium]
MFAMRLYQPASIERNPIQPADLSAPEPGPGQVRIKINVCGVCHTDLHTAEGDIKPPALPVTPGHQVVGVIDAVGEGGRESALGTRVGVPWLYEACGQCEFCRRGEENLCSQARFTGFHVDGGYAEYMLAEARYALPIPDAISDEQAAPLLCAGIVGYRSLKKADIQPGEHVGLFGFGASAHLCIQVLRHWGCDVSVFTRSLGHQDHARGLGAVWAGVAGQDPGRLLDRAVIFAPAGALAVRALELVRPGGTVAINAIHMSDIPSFPYQTIYGERTLRSVANATYQDGAEFLQLAAEIGIRSTVNLYPLKDANQALRDMKESRFNGEAVLTIDAS